MMLSDSTAGLGEITSGNDFLGVTRRGLRLDTLLALTSFIGERVPAGVMIFYSGGSALIMCVITVKGSRAASGSIIVGISSIGFSPISVASIGLSAAASSGRIIVGI